MNVCPVTMELVTGANKAGLAGVLLDVGSPVSNCNVALVATFLNGSTNVSVVAVAAVLEI